ncbi:restriction endonuclease subunit S, partial [Enterococcus faecium]|nr:restriction endonuclease subunit S [Enterococcus faecium]
MINTKALREKILDLAMRGKLVSQDPTDEPASVLLDKIKKEKEQLIKDKKIKKEKPLPEISREEISFEIPKNWECCRLVDLFQFVDYRGKTPNKIGKGVRLITAKNIKPGYISIFPEEFISQEEHLKRNTRGNIEYGDLLITTEAPMGNIAKNTFVEEIAIAQRTIALKPYRTVYREFFLYYLQSYIFQKQLSINSTGTTVKGIKAAKLKNILVSLPPIEEQQRIVAKLEELFALIDTIESNQLEFKQLAEQLDKKVLDLAMRGKLVPQNPTDEPASVLLDEIKEEKEQLIKDKKVKKENPLPEISKEEIPYEIPDSWEWGNLQLIADYIQRGKSPKYSNIERYPVISQKCIQWTGINMSVVRFIEPSSIEKYDDNRIVKNNDILWNSTGTGTVGRVGIVKQDNIDSYEKVVVDS